MGLVTCRIDRLTSRGVRTADGEERDADVVVFATGFDAGESLCPFPVRGRCGTTLVSHKLNVDSKQEQNLFKGSAAGLVT